MSEPGRGAGDGGGSTDSKLLCITMYDESLKKVAFSRACRVVSQRSLSGGVGNYE